MITMSTNPSSEPSLRYRLATNTLGPRLNAIYSLVEHAQESLQKRYDSVWDSCCDHGYLGVKILANQLCSKMHFVDHKPHIIDQLKRRIARYNIAEFEGCYQALAQDVGTLCFAQKQRHLVIIAGVGGEQTINMMSAINKQNSLTNIDFILCPTTTQFDLREYLSGENFYVNYESLVTEKGRDYELLYVTINSTSHKPITLTGAMWQPQNPCHQRYLNKLIRHYHKQCLGGDISSKVRAEEIAKRYQACLS